VALVRRAVVVVVVVLAALAAGCAGGGTGGGPGPSVAPAASGGPAFGYTSRPIDASVRPLLRHSWRAGCPVGLGDLRYLRLDHWGADGRVHRGAMVVHRTLARNVVATFRTLFEARFPVARMQLVDVYQADDDRSMAANNTSAFNCRKVAGSSRWSEHAYGRAIDLNPVQNPYVTRSGRVSPPAGRAWADRARRAPGMVHAGDATVRAFAAIGWGWGGTWRGAKDYQHFSSTGR
jgi:D-alanyl-D-alanine carboxypeptidase